MYIWFIFKSILSIQSSLRRCSQSDAQNLPYIGFISFRIWVFVVPVHSGFKSSQIKSNRLPLPLIHAHIRTKRNHLCMNQMITTDWRRHLSQIHRHRHGMATCLRVYVCIRVCGDSWQHLTKTKYYVILYKQRILSLASHKMRVIFV